MKTKLLLLAAIPVLLLLSNSTIAQSSSLSGNVKSAGTNENLPAVTIQIKGTGNGTFTDDRGNFRISGIKSFPTTLVVSSVGFATQEIVVADASQSLRITLSPASALAQEVVVSASRLPERILESPVTVERVGATAIRNNPATSYYDIVGTLKGVDIITSGLNFKTPSTRGFNSSGNLRLNQLVDGMDNQAPGLNFPVGIMNGLTELDVDNMELLGGASSALYGPGGMNGTLLINSKNPFKYQGLSVQAKGGAMHIADDVHKASGYTDLSLRYGRAVSEKFAFKIGGQYIYAKDWIAQDYRNFDRGTNPAKGNIKDGDRATDLNYNGINVYGDELPSVLYNTSKKFLTAVIDAAYPNPQDSVFATLIASPYLNTNMDVSRTGYKEADVIDPTTKSFKLSGALHYKLTPAIEGSFSANWGSGTTVYTGSDRYNLRDFQIGQYKLEMKHRDWFVRAYTTQEDAGKSYNATAVVSLLNEAWKPSYNPANPSTSWYPQYWGAFAQGAATVFGQAFGAALMAGQDTASAFVTGQSVMLANTAAFHSAARAYADAGRPEVGSAQFRHLFDSVAARPISKGGGLFVDKTSLYMAEGQYNFTDILKSVVKDETLEALVGANYKQYVLNSEGTLFADSAGRIKINEVGVYALASKKLFKDMLKLTVSGRYDKNSNFKGRFTPRFSAVVTPVKNHSIRLSYQTAYRFPSTQNQWINLNVGGNVRLIGGLQQLKDFYHFNTNPVYTAESVFAGNPQKATFGEYKPESATSYEIGYKTLVNQKLLIDAYGYYTKYENFIGRTTVLQSPDGTPQGLANANAFSVSVNSPEKVNTQGWALSVEYLLPHNFSVNANVYSDEIKNVPAGFVTYYNTPKYRTNIGFSNSGFLYKNRVGFTIQYRYQDEYSTQSDFVSGVTPAFFTFDAQVSYKVPAIKTLIKFGGTNLSNHYYATAIGNPYIGALYYASVAYNVF